MIITIQSADPYLAKRIGISPITPKVRTFGGYLIHEGIDLIGDNLRYTLSINADIDLYTLYICAQSLWYVLHTRPTTETEEYWMDYHDYVIGISLQEQILDSHIGVICDWFDIDLWWENSQLFFSAENHLSKLLQIVFVAIWCSLVSPIQITTIDKYVVAHAQKLVKKWIKKLPLSTREWIIRKFTYEDFIIQPWGIQNFITNKDRPSVTNKQLSEFVLDGGYQSIIDTNCGRGHLCYYLIANNKKLRIIGIDKNSDVIKEARKNKPINYRTNKQIANGTFAGLRFINTDPCYPIINTFTPPDLLVIDKKVRVGYFMSDYILSSVELPYTPVENIGDYVLYRGEYNTDTWGDTVSGIYSNVVDLEILNRGILQLKECENMSDLEIVTTAYKIGLELPIVLKRRVTV